MLDENQKCWHQSNITDMPASSSFMSIFLSGKGCCSCHVSITAARHVSETFWLGSSSSCLILQSWQVEKTVDQPLLLVFKFLHEARAWKPPQEQHDLRLSPGLSLGAFWMCVLRSLWLVLILCVPVDVSLRLVVLASVAVLDGERLGCYWLLLRWMRIRS